MTPARSLLLALGLAMVLAATAACGSDDADRDADAAAGGGPGPAEEAVYGVVAVACGTGVEDRATGVAVAAGLVATVAHTFDRAAAVEVHTGSGRAVPADVVWLDVERDVALLRLPDDAGPWLPLGWVEQEAEVSIITAADDPIETKPAVVVRYRDVALDGVGWRAGIELAADIGPGDSGAPVVGPDGALVGIVFATDRAGPTGWAIAADEIGAALAQPKDGPVSLNC